MRDIDMASATPLKFVHALVLGTPKSGKTHFAATAPKPLFISDAAEGGYTTIRDSMDPAYWWDEKVAPRIWAIEDAFTDMPKMLGELESLKASGNFPYQTIVIDPISIYADRYIAEAEMLARKNLKPGKDVDKRALYGDLLTNLRVLLLRFHALPAHVIWLCHPKEGGLAIAGQTADKLPAYMDFTWLTTKTPTLAEPNYELHTQPTGAYNILGGRWTVKDSAGKRWGLPSPMAPSFKAIAQIFNLGEAPSPAMPGVPLGARYNWPPRPTTATE